MADASSALTCGNCREPMQRLALQGHYGAKVDVDLCAGCHLVWFDGTENVRLTGASLVELIDAMGRAQTLAHHVLRRDAGCARCRGALKTVHNQSRWGRSTQLECVNGHGAYTSFAQFLADKGFTRPLSSADRAALLEREGAIHCVGCGAAIGAADSRCPQCQALPALFDLARLARALDPEGAIDDQPVHAAPARRGAFDCPACGAPVTSAVDFRCGHCGATLAVARLGEAAAAVKPLAAALRAHADKPSPKTVARRLATVDRNAAQQRAWAAEMEAQSRQESRAVGWSWGGEHPSIGRWAAAIAAAALALLYLLGR
jgi:hypothetical protein